MNKIFKILALIFLISSVHQRNVHSMECMKKAIISSIRHTPENISHAWKTKHLKEGLLAGLGFTAFGIASGIAGINSESETSKIIFGATGISLSIIGIGTASCFTYVITPIHQTIYDYIMRLKRKIAAERTE